jgi:vacuolar protein-sorting-associated protein 4
MPNHRTRFEILKLHAGTQHCLVEKDFDFLAGKTDGYSGSDISTLVNDGLMRPIKQLQQA